VIGNINEYSTTTGLPLPKACGSWPKCELKCDSRGSGNKSSISIAKKKLSEKMENRNRICDATQPFEATARLNSRKNSVRTAKKTQHFTIAKINWLMLFAEIIAVYSENYTKHKNVA
jgi:hypothetical protein